MPMKRFLPCRRTAASFKVQGSGRCQQELSTRERIYLPEQFERSRRKQGLTPSLSKSSDSDNRTTRKRPLTNLTSFSCASFDLSASKSPCRTRNWRLLSRCRWLNTETKRTSRRGRC